MKLHFICAFLPTSFQSSRFFASWKSFCNQNFRHSLHVFASYELSVLHFFHIIHVTWVKLYNLWLEILHIIRSKKLLARGKTYLF